MNFQNKTQSTTSQVTTQNQSNNQNCIYPKLMEDVNLYWKEQIELIEKIKSDISVLETMFNNYDNNPIFINCKDFLLEKLQEKQDIINNLEEQFYILKRNFQIN